MAEAKEMKKRTTVDKKMEEVAKEHTQEEKNLECRKREMSRKN